MVSGGWDWTLFSGAQGQDKGQWAQVGTQEVPPKHEKNFFPVRVTEQGNWLPREAVESPSLETFKTHVDMVLGTLLWVYLLKQRGWTR